MARLTATRRPPPSDSPMALLTEPSKAELTEIASFHSKEKERALLGPRDGAPEVAEVGGIVASVVAMRARSDCWGSKQRFI